MLNTGGVGRCIGEGLKGQVGAATEDSVRTWIASATEQAVPHAGGVGGGGEGVFIPVGPVCLSIGGDLVDQVIHACESTH